ncbi:MAG TPA: 4-hydroxy-tetrahydrodipicolinate synthase [Nitrospinaceae bacterium]|jgi:4-hydroxy-tetrahydrodipicolinate synthase|nr:4-hydroxy-tetrahydrodipicolinate synthase [Nitrospinaceae bacterium]MDP7108704.1 4-hydroxy-tetrahydrodipicolinate synthase [Nitrospinaceae bacterium]HJO00281.1 4-hydroxy-tetrahydrodipicolinate synthase [Nitrospinaceae bacterium]|tara:strand:+ start:958 stop:1830 length:873 start_codon:yes stop_codon:yes gene_type:complete
MFEGAFVAIVTPFKNGKVDEESLRGLIEYQISDGANGIVPCGTTGESATLSHEEHDLVIRVAVEASKGKVPVLAGTGSNSTQEAIKLTQHAQDAGADGSLQITPYYNKPSQEGLYQHFSSIAADTDLPIILYNVPGRTSVNMNPATVARLAKIKNIVGIKEASGSLQAISEIIDFCGKDFIVLSGDDALLWPILAVGGKGVISVSANILPGKVAEMCKAAADGDVVRARSLHYEMREVNDVLFIDTNPVPVKAALHLMGKIENEVRTPLVTLSSSHLESVKEVLNKHGLY